MANLTTMIPAPSVPVVDPRTGIIDQTWFLFLTQLFNRTGSDSGAVIDVTALAPLASTGGVTPELSIRQATSTLSGAMSAFDKAKLDSLTYTTGTWTPTITFATPGDLAVTYATRTGFFTQVGRTIRLDFSLITSAFTWATAAGQLRITGFPTPASNASFFSGPVSWGGLTYAAGYTQVSCQLLTANPAAIVMTGSGSGLARSVATAATAPSGSTLVLLGHIEYFI